MTRSHLAERNALTIQAHIESLDAFAEAYEQKWGVGRLPLLVAPELAARFNQQRELVNQAVWDDQTETAVKAACEAMQRAWAALDAEAERRGMQPLNPAFWETVTDDGTVVVIARDDPSAWVANRQGRAAVVFTLAEIGKLLNSQKLLMQAKQAFPGGKITGSRKPRAGDLLDDEIPF